MALITSGCVAGPPGPALVITDKTVIVEGPPGVNQRPDFNGGPFRCGTRTVPPTRWP